MKKRRIALAHDWFCGFRGGEAVLDRIARLVLRDHEAASVYVMVSDGRPLSEAVDAFSVRTSFLQRVPGARGKLRRWMLPLFPRAVADLSRKLRADHAREPIDLLISTSSAAIKGLQAPAGVPHLCYCHAPARYVWSQGAEYAGGLRGLGLAAFGRSFKMWDAQSAHNVTRFLANSTHIRQEISRCYHAEATVVHPPVRTEYFTPGDGAREDFWLVAGAHEPYKKTDLAVMAANRAGARLVIAGGGTQIPALKRLAGKTVTFEGRVSDERLRELYRRARVLIFPQVEDFGIVAVEAQACGLPVVARRAGGALDTVIDGGTGEYFDAPTVEGVIAAVERVPKDCGAACRRNAERFSEAVFDEAMSRQIGELLAART